MAERTPIDVRREKVTKALERLEGVYAALGTQDGKPSFDYSSLEGTERLSMVISVGEIKEEINARTRPRLEALAARLDQSEQLSKLERFVADGLIPQAELDRARVEFGVSGSKTDRSAQVETRAELPLITISKKDKRVTFGDKSTVVWGKVSFAVLTHLSERFGERISLDELNEVAKKAGSNSKHPASAALHTLRSILKSEDTDLITYGGSRGSKTFGLNARVEFIREAEKQANAGSTETVKTPKNKDKKRGKRDPRSVKMPDGKGIKILGDLERKMVQLLTGSTRGKAFSIADVALEVFGEDTENTRSKARMLITRGKKTLGTFRWKVNVKHAGKGSGKKEARYWIEKLPPKEFPVHLQDRHIRSLGLLIGNGLPQDVVGALGEDKRGRKFNNATAKWALRNAIRNLVMRKSRGFLKEDESKLYEKLSVYAQEHGGDLGNWKDVAKQLLSRLSLNKAELAESQRFEETEMEAEALNLEEASFYVAFLKQRKDLLKKYGFEQVSEQLTKRIISRLDKPLKRNPEELEELKKRVFGKALSIAKSDAISALYDELDDVDLQDLLIHMTPSESQNLDFLEEILREPVNGYGQKALDDIEALWEQVKRDEHNQLASTMNNKETFGGTLTQREKSLIIDAIRVIRESGFDASVTPETAKKMFSMVDPKVFDDVVRPRAGKKDNGMYDVERVVLAVVLSKLDSIPNAKGVGHLRKKVNFVVNEKWNSSY